MLLGNGSETALFLLLCEVAKSLPKAFSLAILHKKHILTQNRLNWTPPSFNVTFPTAQTLMESGTLALCQQVHVPAEEE